MLGKGLAREQTVDEPERLQPCRRLTARPPVRRAPPFSAAERILVLGIGVGHVQVGAQQLVPGQSGLAHPGIEFAGGCQDCCVVLRTELAEQLDDAGTVKIRRLLLPFPCRNRNAIGPMLSLQAAPVEG